MKFSYLILFLFILQSGCKKEEVLQPTSYLADQSFKSGLRIDGHEFDSLVIENCTFENGPLNIGNVNHLIVRNCSFQNIKNNGLKIGFIGKASDIRIENCHFKNIAFNGIDSHERAPNCVISGCYFENIAQSDIGSAMGQPHHGIYWKGQNVLIENNVFIKGSQNKGNAISLRSSGIVRGNVIQKSAKNGIMYFTDHPGGDSLLIENNFLINCGVYSIILASNGIPENHNKKVIIRFNSMVQTENPSVYVSAGFEPTSNISVYGNIMVNSSQEYIRKFSEIPDIHHNLESPTDIGFKNMTSGDLHLMSTSEAIDYCSGLSLFPQFDIDGDLRITPNFDAGADEFR